VRVIGSIGTAVVLAMGIAVFISWIGALDQSVVRPSGEPMVVFSDHRTRPITEQTVVDELLSLDLKTDIRKVSLDSSMMEIDLAVSPNEFHELSIQEDVASVTVLALAKSENIQRVFIRVLERNEKMATEKARLLLAVTGGKEGFNEQELQRLRDGERMPASWLETKMRRTETQRWREMIQ
jgi:hypothetical protein